MKEQVVACVLTAAVLVTGCTTKSQVEAISEEKIPVRMSYEPVESFYSVPLETDIQRRIKELCAAEGIEPTVILAMIDVESSFEAKALGDGGNSYGLMQIQPRWYSERMAVLGVTDLFDPKQNVTVGIDILAELVAKYDGNIEMALVAYNAGPTGAYRHWFSRGVYSSDYSTKVLEISSKLKEGS